MIFPKSIVRNLEYILMKGGLQNEKGLKVYEFIKLGTVDNWELFEIEWAGNSDKLNQALINLRDSI